MQLSVNETPKSEDQSWEEKTIVKHENQTSYQEFQHERAMVVFSSQARG